MVTKDLGMVTAYAYAVAGGYTGTEAEFTQLMADLAVVVDDFDNFSVNVTTLPAGSSATASYADGVLSLGIPKGDKGDKGNTGETGAPAGFGTVSATVDDSIGTPSVEVTASGADTAKNFAFAFHNLKGQKGDKGDTGEVSEAELTLAFADFSENGTVANAEQLTTDIKANDQSPYLFRTSGGSVDIGDREYINGIVGGTVAWNQTYDPTAITSNTVNGVTFTVNSDGTIVANGTATALIRKAVTAVGLGVHTNVGHKLLYWGCPSGGSASGYKLSVAYIGEGTRDIGNGAIWSIPDTEYSGPLAIIIAEGTVCDNLVFKPQIFDLTQMFGSTIADYIYSLEQATTGAGVAYFKKLFPKPYYAYNAGELKSVSGLVSHDMTGFNQWDEEWEVGAYDTSDGAKITDVQKIRSKHKIKALPNTTYCIAMGIPTPSAGYAVILCYDSSENYLGYRNRAQDGTFTTLDNTGYIAFYISAAYGTTYKNDICINLSWDGSRDGEYEPYIKHSYPLDSDLTLRGIPKLDANNNLYYDGDVYEPDGTVTRKYGIVDLGTVVWSKTAVGSFYVFHHTFSDKALNYNFVCALYPNSEQARDNMPDKSSGCYNNSGYRNIVCIRDDSKSTLDVDQFKTAMDGVYLVYELATPTTETADPFTSPQIVNDFGTEEFVISNTVAVPIPVGHNTDYPINLKAKVEMMPNSPSGDGDYIVRQTNGTNEYVSLAGNATIQDIISRLEALENA